MIINGLNPAFILIVGGLLVPLLHGTLRKAFMLALPLLGIMQLWGLPYGEMGLIQIFEFQLVTLRLDQLSFIFALIFFIAAFLGVLYA